MSRRAGKPLTLTEGQAEARSTALAKLDRHEYERTGLFHLHPQCCRPPLHLAGHALDRAIRENA